MAEDFKLWDVICDRPFVPTKNLGDPAVVIPKTRKEFNDDDRKTVEKNFCAKKILVCGIGPNEYNMISAYQSAKKIWEALQTTHEGTTQVKQSKIDMLTNEYELFRMKDDESIQDMNTRFSSIINELHSLEVKDLQELTIDELVGNLKTYEMKKKKDNERREPKKEKNLVLKTDMNDSSGEDALAAWGDSSSESDEENDHGDRSMMAVESEATEYDTIFALMAQSDDDEDDDDDELNFLDVQRNLKSYSPKKLISLTHVLIDAYHSLINDKYALTVELGEAEQTRDDLVDGVVNLKETIENLKKEKDALDKKIANIKHEKDDLMIVVVNLKETIKCVKREKEVLSEKVTNLEHERDDLLVVIVDLKETIGEPKMESRPENSKKGKGSCKRGTH
ncbi:MAR-binding filament-like protein 1 [Nicotiana sylvestris]|uniref:MAR-binding filament-like protein 1 n=1 Tax=Nicotiana sylvestris TaxID=4096 RepID=UPI00388C6607